MIRCRSARRAIELALDDRLSLNRRFQLEEHLEACADCRELSVRTQRVEDALLSRPEPPAERVDLERSVAAIRVRLEPVVEEAAPAKSASPRVLVGLLTVAASTVLILALQESTPTVETTSTQREPNLEAVASNIELPESAEPGQAPPPEEPLDHERLARTREAVRRQLLEASAGLEPDASREQVEAFAELFDVSTVALRESEWPVRRLVERLLESEDDATASAAARYLGLRGDSASFARLARNFERPLVARAATLALCDAGEAGIPGLGIALALPAQRGLALGFLREQDPELVAPVLAERLAEECREDPLAATSRDLVQSLVALGDPGLDSLFELYVEESLTVDALLAALEGDPASARWIREALDEGTRGRDFDRLLDLATVLSPEEQVPRLLELLDDRRWRSTALDHLPRVSGRAGVLGLLRISDDSRISSDELIAMSRMALAQNAVRFAHVAEDLADAGDHASLATLAELVLAADTPDGLEPALALAQRPELHSSVGQNLLLSLGQWGSDSEVATLVDLFARFGFEDRHLAAACLISLHELGGDSAVRLALDDLDSRTTTNILHLLRQRGAERRTNPSIYKIARELRTFLGERNFDSWRTSS